MSNFYIFEFPASFVLRASQHLQGAGIGRRTLQGTLQEGHRGSAGQGN
ncbi:unnamed protein product [Staurois parvus]|uniref:Uncharacterized protein n=1 Tax=Staurois parvus TaxID=386267 RepID=A0ABN9G455_9NEOB|nr:unnamed protein product [Staurois parvus]